MWSVSNLNGHFRRRKTMCADWIPVVSQVKSLVQVIAGDAQGARTTQENFSRQCPVVSQVRSAVEASLGDPEAATETQLEFVRTVSGITDGIPVVGHIKGGIHYAVGDKDGGDEAMKAASRTTGAIAGGVGGFVVGGPPAAVAGGIGGAAAVDGLISGIDSAVHKEERLYGIVDQGQKLTDNPKDAGEWFNTGLMVVGDGLAGYGAGGAVKAGRIAGKTRVTVKKIAKSRGTSTAVKAGARAAKDVAKASGIGRKASDHDDESD